MTTALLGLGRVASEASIRVAHRGVYFETRALLRTLPFITEATFAQTSDVVINEPICCDGQFHQIDTAKLLSASPRAVIFDTTLMGRDDGVDSHLAALAPRGRQAVIRVASCLKLLQSGLELANCGDLSVTPPTPALPDWASNSAISARSPGPACISSMRSRSRRPLCSMRPTRTATPPPSSITTPASHTPSIRRTSGSSPSPIRPSPTGTRLSALSACATPRPPPTTGWTPKSPAKRCRRLNFARGGSFGFRGHRYEIVKPDTGEAPFLRIAMGRRNGFSCEGVIAMMAETAKR